LRHLVPDIAEREVFVCGPDAWMDAALTAAQQAGVPVERLHAEHFAW
jgi:ferredoxin-NADP reductase